MIGLVLRTLLLMNMLVHWSRTSIEHRKRSPLKSRVQYFVFIFIMKIPIHRLQAQLNELSQEIIANRNQMAQNTSKVNDTVYSLSQDKFKTKSHINKANSSLNSVNYKRFALRSNIFLLLNFYSIGKNRSRRSDPAISFREESPF